MLLPFVTFMVKDFVPTDVQHIGLRAGLISMCVPCFDIYTFTNQSSFCILCSADDYYDPLWVCVGPLRPQADAHRWPGRERCVSGSFRAFPINGLGDWRPRSVWALQWYDFVYALLFADK